MRIGVPTEIKEDENRVAITPAGVAAFKVHGHEVVVQSEAGNGSHIWDGVFRSTGAIIVDEAAPVWERRSLSIVSRGRTTRGGRCLPGEGRHVATADQSPARRVRASRRAWQAWHGRVQGPGRHPWSGPGSNRMPSCARPGKCSESSAASGGRGFRAGPVHLSQDFVIWLDQLMPIQDADAS